MFSIFFRPKTYWLRKRLKGYIDDIKLCIDYTKDYGYIVEVEKLVDDEKQTKQVEIQLKNFLMDLIG